MKYLVLNKDYPDIEGRFDSEEEALIFAQGLSRIDESEFEIWAKVIDNVTIDPIWNGVPQIYNYDNIDSLWGNLPYRERKGIVCNYTPRWVYTSGVYKGNNTRQILGASRYDADNHFIQDGRALAELRRLPIEKQFGAAMDWLLTGNLP